MHANTVCDIVTCRLIVVRAWFDTHRLFAANRFIVHILPNTLATFKQNGLTRKIGMRWRREESNSTID